MLKRLKECLRRQRNLIRNIWKPQTGCILDVRFRTLMHYPTFIGNQNQSLCPLSVTRRRHTSRPAWTNAVTPCYPFVVSCDGVLGNEARVVLQNLAGSLAKKSSQEVRKVLFRSVCLSPGRTDQRHLFVGTVFLLVQYHRGPMAGSRHGAAGDAGGIDDLGSTCSLLKLIVLHCRIMRSAWCEELWAKKARGDDPEVQEELLLCRFGPASGKVTATLFDLLRLHAGKWFLAVLHRLAASRSTSASITACLLGPVIWGPLGFSTPANGPARDCRAVLDGRYVSRLVLMRERAMTDLEPHLRSAATTLTWHLVQLGGGHSKCFLA
jgi:hypothetical protein